LTFTVKPDENQSKIQEFNDEVIAKQELVGRAGTGDFLLLKGSAWPQNKFPAVHRSPPLLARDLTSKKPAHKHAGHSHEAGATHPEVEDIISVRVLVRIDFVSQETAKKLMESEAEDEEDEEEGEGDEEGKVDDPMDEEKDSDKDE